MLMAVPMLVMMIRHRALGTKWSAPRLMQPREVEDCSFLRAQTPKFPGASGRFWALPGASGRFRGFPRGPPEGDFLTPLTRIVASDPPLEAPDRPQDTPEPSRGPQRSPKGLQSGPKRPQRGPKRLQDGPGSL